jgi:checkpoint serine/threonine-protein kinase
LINYHFKSSLAFPYWFVLYLTWELLHILNYLQKCEIIHADIKVDNLLVNQLPDGGPDFFEPTHRTKCLVLIDFNRSIDLRLLPVDAEFEAKTRRSLQCCEMRADKPWTFQVDYYGVAASIYSLIFKNYMKTSMYNGRNKFFGSIPRQFDSLFGKLFDSFLNIPSCRELPRLEDEFIAPFLALFETELAHGGSFGKSKKYLDDLNREYSARK